MESEDAKVHFDVNNVLSCFCLETHKKAPPLGVCVLFLFRKSTVKITALRREG